jgi:hypothetical protein
VRTVKTLVIGVASVMAVVAAHPQAPAGPQGRGGRAQQPTTPRAAAPFDITGYWVAVVTQDWRFRAVTPPKGDYAGVPINAAAKQVADTWDPAKDEAAGDQCRAYGAPNVMRIPGRLHIAWQDDRTLEVDIDAGTQTRTWFFDNPPQHEPTWQGTSQAQWDALPGRRGQPPLLTSLKVVTTNLRPGYLRKNGLPYSAHVTLTEYFDRVNEGNGDAFLIVTTTIEDPDYLTQPYLYSTHFKRQADATGWSPSPCRSR